MLESTPVTRHAVRPRDGTRPPREREQPGLRVADLRDSGPQLESTFDDPIPSASHGATLSGSWPQRRSEVINRLVNIALAALALIILSPIFLLVALAVWLTSRGPVIYVQERVGIDRRARLTLAMYDRRAADVGGCVFEIYKFRTMRVDAELHSGAVWATKNDPRVTRVGRFLRRTRLDELPQLFNVLRGDMNIVGPRPERPTIFVNLRENIAEYPLRQKAKPGITGLAQINHDYDQSLEDVRTKVSYDLKYLQRQSLW